MVIAVKRSLWSTRFRLSCSKFLFIDESHSETVGSFVSTPVTILANTTYKYASRYHLIPSGGADLEANHSQPGSARAEAERRRFVFPSSSQHVNIYLSFLGPWRSRHLISGSQTLRIHPLPRSLPTPSCLSLRRSQSQKHLMKVREGIWVQVDGRAINQAALVVCRIMCIYTRRDRTCSCLTVSACHKGSLVFCLGISHWFIKWAVLLCDGVKVPRLCSAAFTASWV